MKRGETGETFYCYRFRKFLSSPSRQMVARRFWGFPCGREREGTASGCGSPLSPSETRPAYLPDECRRQRRCRGSGAALLSPPPPPSPSSRMTKPRESWSAAAPKSSAAARTVFAILSILPLSSFVVLFRLHPPYCDTLQYERMTPERSRSLLCWFGCWSL